MSCPSAPWVSASPATARFPSERGGMKELLALWWAGRIAIWKSVQVNWKS